MNDKPLISGTCPNCGSPIYSSTYADWCDCGDCDYSYMR